MIKDDGGPHHHHPPQDLCLHLLPLCQEPGPSDPAVRVELHRHSVAPARHLSDHFQDDDASRILPYNITEGRGGLLGSQKKII